MRAEVLAVVAGFVTIDEIESAGVVGEGAESHAGEYAWFVLGSAGLVVFASHLSFHGTLLDNPEASSTPAGYRHGVDEILFDTGLRLEFVVKASGEVDETLLVLAVDDDVCGEDAVFDGILGGGTFALLSNGATGFTAVVARGLVLEF